MNVLFVCTANVCRSPLAEGYFRHLLEKSPIPGLEVASAGVLAHDGSPAFDCVVEVARLSGFELQNHRARKLIPKIAHAADLILCMESWQASMVLDLDERLLEKTALLGSYHPSRNNLFQIPDPRSFDVPCTMDVFELIRLSVHRLHEKFVPSASNT